MTRYALILSLVLAGPLTAQDGDPVLTLYQSARADLAAGKFADAERKLLVAYDKSVEQAGADHPNTALVQYELGEVYLTRAGKGDLDRAAAAYKQVLAVREKALGPDATSTINAADRLGEVYGLRRQFKLAEPLLLRAVKSRVKTLPPTHGLISRSYDHLAELYADRGDHRKAEWYFLKNLEFNELAHGKDSMAVASCLNLLSVSLVKTGQYLEAEKGLLRAVAIAEGVAKGRAFDLSVPLGNLAWAQMLLGRHAEAEATYGKALTAAVKHHGKDDLEVAVVFSGMGELQMRLGRAARAEEYAARGLAIRRQKLGDDAALTLQSRHDLGEIQYRSGQFAKAEVSLTAALAGKEALLGPRDPAVAVTLNSLGMLALDMARHDKAEALHKRALNIREGAFGSESSLVANSLTNLADVAYRRQDYELAEKLYPVAIGIYEKSEGVDSLQLVAPLNNLARSIADSSGRVDLALYLRAYEIVTKSYGPDHVTAHRLRSNVGRAYFQAQRYAEAEPYFRKASAAVEKALGANHPDAISAKFLLARNEYALARPEEARRLMDSVRRANRDFVTGVLPSLSPDDQRRFLLDADAHSLWVALGIGLAHAQQPEFAEASAAWAVNGKATLAEVQSISTRLANTSGSPAADALRKVREELTQLSLAGQGADDARAGQRREALQEQARGLEAELRRAGGDLGRALPYVELADLRKRLPKRSAFVDVVRLGVPNLNPKVGEQQVLPARYVAWVTLPAGQSRVVDLGLADPIDTLVEAARKDLNAAAKSIQAEGEPAAEKKTRAALLAVAEKVLHPLLKEVGDAEELVLSPDGSLWLLPWAALPLPDGKYAVESFRVRYVVSGRDLVREPSAGEATAPLIVADPDFDLDPADALKEAKAILGDRHPRGGDTRGLAASLNLGPVGRLPGTATEAEAIAPRVAKWLGTKPRVLVEKQALKSVVKAARGPEALVLSTHGFFKADQRVEPAETGGVGPAGRRAIKAVGGQPYQDPLTRCGLLLAACNAPKNAAGPVTEDGLLTGLEVLNCDLRGTKLVVLSACETGLGDVRNGEGVAGLRQAFQLAGAEGVVATLWQIPDAQSAQLMVGFFDNLSKGQARAEALRGSQREMVEQRRGRFGAAHPFFWAAYTFTGN